jgi:hypothetical protein
MKLKTLFWPIVTVLGTVIGWYFGRQSIEAINSSDQSGSSAVVAQAAQPDSKASNTAQALEQKARASAEQMGLALANQNHLKALHGFLTALDGMTVENDAAFSDAWRKLLAEGRAPMEFHSYFNRRRGEVIGAKILAERTGDANDYKAFGAVCEELRGAMTIDPAGVRAWYDGLKDERFREGLFQPYVTALAMSDPNAVLALIPSLPTDIQPKCIASVTSALLKKGGDAGMRNWFDQQAGKVASEQPPWLQTAFSDVLNKIPINRYAASEWAVFLEKHLGQAYADTKRVGTIASSYVYSDPAGALAWAQRIATKDPTLNPGQLYARMTKDAREEDLPTIADWCLKELSGDQRAQALAGIQSRATALTPEKQAILDAKLKTP